MTPRPPDTPPESSKFRTSPRAVIWLKRQLCLLLTNKHGTRTNAERVILLALEIDPDVFEYFDALKDTKPTCPPPT